MSLPSPSIPTVAVIGAGFSGTIAAAHLLRRAAEAPARVLLIDRSGGVGRGVAYGTRSVRHVLNVPAGRMSAFAADEDDFLRFARSRDAHVVGGSFVPRRLYGEYLAATLDQAEQFARAHGGSLMRIGATVTDVVVDDGERGGVRLLLADGAALAADRAIVAVGNFPPADPPIPGSEDFFRSTRYVRDPWAGDALAEVPGDAPVLLIGTGLTMLDVAIELAARDRRAPLIALSRRGLVPLPHRPNGAPPSYGHLPPGLIACEPTAVAYLRAIRRHVRTVARDGVDWRDVVASLRPMTPRLWETLPLTERRRFLRHARAYWDVHRHRVAPELHLRFEALRDEDMLQLSAGRLLRLAEHGDGVDVTWRPRGAAAEETRSVAAVVNCTGPAGDVRSIDDALLRALLGRQAVRADPLGLGLDVAPDGHLLRGDGTPNPHLALASPLLRARYWEATAVPELRLHAARAVTTTLASLATATLP
ncbi:MAG: FAD/NAD(P)-binding protein [Gemmatimonadaceae bacterium]|nr:FAD/NAD(P)-binding protein [Gemmatimonadaceae bacterium]